MADGCLAEGHVARAPLERRGARRGGLAARAAESTAWFAEVVRTDRDLQLMEGSAKAGGGRAENVVACRHGRRRKRMARAGGR